MPDHIHMLLSVPPKYSIMVIGYLKGKSATPDSPGVVAHERNAVRPEFLGPGVLLEHRRAGRGENPALRPQPGEAPT